jgi:hypothetical protein
MHRRAGLTADPHSFETAQITTHRQSLTVRCICWRDLRAGVRLRGSAKQSGEVWQYEKQSRREHNQPGLTNFRALEHSKCLFLLFLSDRNPPAPGMTKARVGKGETKEQVSRSADRGQQARDESILL